MKQLVVTFAGSAGSPEQFPRDGLPEVAFLGRSNVGKSSLLNAMAGKKNLARVSSSPGKTRLVNFFRVDSEMYLADLPGYGYARVSKEIRESWDTLASSYLVGRDALALCVMVLDARREPSEKDDQLRVFLDRHQIPYMIAASKTDTLGRGEVKTRRGQLERGIGRCARAVIPVSAETGDGVEELWKSVRAAARRED